MPKKSKIQEGRTFVFTYLPDDGFVLAGELTMSLEMRVPYARFTYVGSYLKRRNAFSLDPVSLPLIDGEQETEDGFSVFSGIRDAAPDGWGRHLLNRAAGELELSEFDYLVRSGDDRVGSLAFGPTPEKPERLAYNGEIISDERFSVEELQEIVAKGIAREGYSKALKRMFYRGSSGLGGARPKGTANFDDGIWLAKFSRVDDSYNQPAIEYANMSLAKKAGIDVPRLMFLTLTGGESVFLIERFDRHIDTGGQLKRRPFISSLTALGGHESDINRWGYSDLAAYIFNEVPKAADDLQQLFRRMVFNVLTGNTDDHLRNHGFLFDFKTALWRLSPAYDVVPQAGLHSEEKFGFLKLAHGRQLTIENALGLADAFQLTDEDAKKIIAEVFAVVKDWQAHFRAQRVSDREIDALEKPFSETTRLAAHKTLIA
jgi:serine/threonine-protein kinase HipA